MAVVSVLVFSFLHCAAFAQPPKETRQIFVTFIAPASFEELWSESDAVVHVKVLGSRAVGAPRHVPEVRGNFTSYDVKTEHRVRVIEVFRGRDGLRSGIDLNVRQTAGEIELDDKIVKIADQIPLRPSAEYVLFLHWHTIHHDYEIWQGHHGVYEVRNGKMEPASRWRVSEPHRGKPAADFLGELRARVQDQK